MAKEEVKEDEKTKTAEQKLGEMLKGMPDDSKVCGFWRVRKTTPGPTGGQLLNKIIGDLEAGTGDITPQMLTDKLFSIFPEAAKKGGKFYFSLYDQNKQPVKGETIMIEVSEEEKDVEPEKMPVTREELNEMFGAKKEDDRLSRLESAVDKLTSVVTDTAKPKEDSKLTELLVSTFQDAKEARKHEVEIAQIKANEEDKKRQLEYNLALKKIEADVEKHQAELTREKEKAAEDQKRWERDFGLKEKEMEKRLEEMRKASEEKIEWIKQINETKKGDPSAAKTLSDALTAVMGVLGTVNDLKAQIGDLPSSATKGDLMDKFEKLAGFWKDITIKKMELDAVKSAPSQTQIQTETQTESGGDMLEKIFAKVDPEFVDVFTTGIENGDKPDFWLDAVYEVFGAVVPMLVNTPWDKIANGLLGNTAVSEKAKAVLKSDKARTFWTGLVKVIREDQNKPPEV